MIVRIDDVGYTPVNNIGLFRVFDQGVGTSADVMLDTPGTKEALELLRGYSWLSIGWHTHFWGSPVLGPDQVPHLIDHESGQFRADLNRIREDADVRAELAKEMEAQIRLCIRILGKAPDTTEIMEPEDTEFFRMKEQTAKRFGIAIHFSSRQRRDREGRLSYTKPDPKWEDRKIVWMDPGPAYRELFSDSLEEMGKYDPVRYYTEDLGKMMDLPEDIVCGQAWHPGYVDDYVAMDGDKGPKARNFIECRLTDIRALCSRELKDWIIENRIELVSFTDALYGRQDYQNHLLAIGSDLCML